MTLYSVSKPVERFRIGAKWAVGLVLLEYSHAGKLYNRPVYATTGREYLSNLTGKGHGRVFIPETLLKERDQFKIIIGKRGHRKIYWLKDCRVECGYFRATLHKIETDEEKELHPVLFVKAA